MTKEKYLRICIEQMHKDLHNARTPEQREMSEASIENFYRNFENTFPDLVEEYRGKRGEADG